MSVETSKQVEADVVSTEETPAEQAEMPAGWSTPLPDFLVLGVGRALRLRREALGWELPDVAAWLRIKLPYLEALEHDRADSIPAGAYALGFLRTYASALGFPAEQMVERFKREVRSVAQKPELTFLTPEPERTVPAGALVMIGLVVVVGAYIGWYKLFAHDPVSLEQVPSVASVMPGISGHAEPSPQIVSMMPGAVPSSQSTRPVLPAGAGSPTGIAQQPTAKPSTQEQTAADIGRSLSPAPLGQGAFLPDASSPAQPGPDSAFTGPPPVVAKPAAIRALAKCWVQVKAADGEVLYDHIMAPDDSWEFPAGKGPFTMTAGNAGGVVLTVDNLRTKPLGGNGEVRRRIAVSEQAIRDGSIAALDTSVADPSASGAVISPAGEVVAAPDEEAPVVLPPPPVVRPRVVRPRVAPAAKEISADDLNARQLKSLGGGAP